MSQSRPDLKHPELHKAPAGPKQLAGLSPQEVGKAVGLYLYAQRLRQNGGRLLAEKCNGDLFELRS